MEHLDRNFVLLLAIVSSAFASDNGKYYKCDEDILAADNQCIFTLTGDQPDDWIQETVLHNVDRTVGKDFCRGVMSYAGVMLSVSPKPWVNGDVLVGSTDKITGDDWSGYALIFELMAPLRDMMMYNPSALDEDTWNKFTRALTDCKAKTEDYVSSRSGGSAFSTSQVYEYIKDPQNKDIHHYVLQYLEEGTMDLVCLSTDLEMDHCDAIREAAGYKDGERCNCWFDAYNAIYEKCPVVAMEFTTCEKTVAPAECTGPAVEDDGEGCEGDDTDNELPSPPDMPDGPPDGAPAGPPAGAPAGPPGRR